MTRWDVCNDTLTKFPVSRFLEIGTGFGRGARLIDANLKVGVDPWPRGNLRGYDYFHRSSSDSYFYEKNPPKFHVILIDGLHHAEQVLRDVEHGLEHLEHGGMIVVHDCNPQEELDQVIPRPAGRVHWNGDCWKVIASLRATQRHLHVVTLNADEGLGIIQPSPEHDTITLAEPLTWDGLVRNRAEWLGLA